MNNLSNYKTIDGMLSAEEAAYALEHHVDRLADGIRNKNNCVFVNRCKSIIVLLNLLSQYTEQK